MMTQMRTHLGNNRSAYLAAILLLAVAVGLLIMVRFSTNEDSWICENNEWIKHGNPATEHPQTGCEFKTAEIVSQNQKETPIILISSGAFAWGASIPIRFTCDGQNISPPLELANVPEGAKTVALIMDDPDAPRGIFTHWLWWNVPVDVSEISEASVPKNAIQGSNTSGKQAYSGPCPPTGRHQYRWFVYALDNVLELAEGSSRTDLEQAMSGHILAQGLLVGLYNR